MRGLYNKYTVLDADSGKVTEGKCFVLKPESDPVALMALKTYCIVTLNKKLRQDLIIWIKEIEEAK